MNNFEFLKKYQQLQYSIMFDKLIDFDFATVAYCRGDSSPFWNQALVNQIIDNRQLRKIEETIRRFNRKPAIYFENRKNLQTLIDYLKENNYKFCFEDSWMFHCGRNINPARFGQVKKIANKGELELFLKTFDACYQKNDPQNAYGELGDYLKVAKKVWYRHHQTDRLEYFLVYKNQAPVAVSTLTNFKGIGYISNVGSLKKVRGQGFGKLATLYCVEQSKKRGNEKHCLATEEGTFANKFYKRIGFKTNFTAVAYVKGN